VRVHLAGEHPLKFEPFDFELEAIRVRLDFIRCALITLRSGQFQQFPRVGESLGEPLQAAHHGFELRALFAEFLRAIGVVPDAGLFELAAYFGQPLILVVVIKDTPSRNPYDPRDL
jgi:hypothetical protein